MTDKVTVNIYRKDHKELQRLRVSLAKSNTDSEIPSFADVIQFIMAEREVLDR